jgi:hypothetical protein
MHLQWWVTLVGPVSIHRLLYIVSNATETTVIAVPVHIPVGIALFYGNAP